MRPITMLPPDGAPGFVRTTCTVSHSNAHGERATRGAFTRTLGALSRPTMSHSLSPYSSGSPHAAISRA